MSVWVVNTSPLVFRGSLGRLGLLRREGWEVCTPRAVAEEVAKKPDAAAQAVQAACGTRKKRASSLFTIARKPFRHGQQRSIPCALSRRFPFLTKSYGSFTPMLHTPHTPARCSPRPGCGLPRFGIAACRNAACACLLPSSPSSSTHPPPTSETARS